MAQPYIGEIRMFAGNFAPAGWMMCEGQLLSIEDNYTFFQLIGTTYGGDGQSTFGLPDLRGRLPLHQGTGPGLTGHTLAETGGIEAVTLTATQIPVHSHPLQVSRNTAGGSSATGNVPGQVGATKIYREFAPDTAMSTSSVGFTGGSQPHTNLQPYLCVNFIISLFGLYPSVNPPS